METIPCPGCRTALEPSSTVCPICLRPRGKIEITRAYATLREMEKQRRRRPFVAAAYVAAAAAAGGLVYRFHAPVAAFAVSARARAGAFITSELDSAVSVPHPPAAPATAAPAPVAQPAPLAAATPPAGAVPVPQAAVPRPAAPATPAASVMPPPPVHVNDLPLPAIDSSTQWIVYGRVYDLSTLKPVPMAQINFLVISEWGPAGGLPSGVIESDQYGRYVAVLRRLPDGSSYEIHSMGAGYTSPVLYESDIPYAQLPVSDRRDIVQNARDGDLTLPPLTDVAGVNAVRRDIFLAPIR